MAKGVGLAIVLGGVITAGAGIANAAPPSGTTLIACSDTKKGDLRLVKAASECDKKKEKVVTWNVVGHPGRPDLRARPDRRGRPDRRVTADRRDPQDQRVNPEQRGRQDRQDPQVLPAPPAPRW